MAKLRAKERVHGWVTEDVTGHKVAVRSRVVWEAILQREARAKQATETMLELAGQLGGLRAEVAALEGSRTLRFARRVRLLPRGTLVPLPKPEHPGDIPRA